MKVYQLENALGGHGVYVLELLCVGQEVSKYEPCARSSLWKQLLGIAFSATLSKSELSLKNSRKWLWPTEGRKDP